MKKLASFLILLNSSVALASLSGVSTHQVSVKAGVSPTLELSSFAKSPVNKGPLAVLKWNHLRGNYEECASLASKNIGQAEKIKGWFFLTWGECARRAANKKNSYKPMRIWAQAINNEQIAEGPWTDLLGELRWRTLWNLIDQDEETKPHQAWQWHLQLQKLLNNQGRENKAQYYESLGDVALKLKKRSEAVYFWSTSYTYAESASLAKKIVENGGELQLIESGNSQDAEEAILSDQIKRLHDKKDWDTLLSRIAEILQERPSSKISIYWASQLPEMIKNLERKDDTQSAAKKLRDLMLAQSFVRLEEWARVAHKKNDYNFCLLYSEKALESKESGPLSTSLYWLAGRSAHFLAQYDRALGHFEKLMQSNPTSPEGLEARLRTGLIMARKSKWSEAAGNFKYLLAAKGAEKYELSARYWLARVSERFDEAERNKQFDAIQAKFPFSYYGLRLFIEKNKGEGQWPVEQPEKPKTDRKVSLFLLKEQEQAWSRIKFLAKNGWWLEAQGEISQLAEPPRTEQKLAFVSLAAEAGAFPFVVRWMSELADVNRDFATSQWMASAFPKSFSNIIDSEAPKNKIDPDLVRSLIRQESAFGMRAVSTSNAQGLMQMIPPTAREIAGDLNLKNIEIPDDVFQPALNIKMGTYYLGKMLKFFNGNVPLALGAYNAGPGKLNDWLKSRPEIQTASLVEKAEPLSEIWYDELPWSETSFYIKAILRNVLLNKSLEKGRVSLPLVLWQDLYKQN